MVELLRAVGQRMVKNLWSMIGATRYTLHPMQRVELLRSVEQRFVMNLLERMGAARYILHLI